MPVKRSSRCATAVAKNLAYSNLAFPITSFADGSRSASFGGSFSTEYPGAPEASTSKELTLVIFWPL